MGFPVCKAGSGWLHACCISLFAMIFWQIIRCAVSVRNPEEDIAMRVILGLLGVAALGAALGPLGWLVWLAHTHALTTILTYQLVIAVLVALLIGACCLAANCSLNRRSPVPTVAQTMPRR
jgi:hypothetical protein